MSARTGEDGFDFPQPALTEPSLWMTRLRSYDQQHDVVMETEPIVTLFAQPFTLQQALAAGQSRTRLKAMLLDRRIRRVVHGVYAHASLVDTFELRLAALQLVMKPHVIVSGRTAAWLYGVDAFSFADLEDLPGADTCVLPAQSRMRRASCKGHRRDLAPHDVVALGHLAVTSPVRTALDLGSELRRREALATLDWFVRLDLCTKPALLNELRRFSRRRGVVQLRELVALADGRSESPGESWTRLALIDEGLPAPELQWSIRWLGRQLYRLDLAYPKHRVCVEYDGEEFHDSIEARERDEARRLWLRMHGWIVIVVGKDDFTSVARTRWTAEVRAALASRHH